MMSSIHNIREAERLQHERDRQWREYERQSELMREMYRVPAYRIEFTETLLDGMAYMVGDVIYMPESQAYKFIFMNNNVSDQNIQFAINHAVRKVNRFIDNYKV